MKYLNECVGFLMAEWFLSGALVCIVPIAIIVFEEAMKYKRDSSAFKSFLVQLIFLVGMVVILSVLLILVFIKGWHEGFLPLMIFWMVIFIIFVPISIFIIWAES